ncbi:hypothetical protein ACLB2K_054493 [Fragaria x ananassa]
MSSSSSVANRAWMVAASVGAVEALKRDQGICRLSQTMRLVQQHAKTHLRSLSQANQRLSSSYSALFSRKLRDEMLNQSEESMRNVMYLNSWVLSKQQFQFSIFNNMSSSALARRAWIVAASVGVVEALKDQGICRWNYTMKLMQQQAKTHLRSYSQAHSKLSSSSSALVSSKLIDDKAKHSEESLRKVMYLSCWGPN